MQSRLFQVMIALITASICAPTAVAVVKGKKKRLKVIDIRGFGDGGFVGRSHKLVKPEEWQIEQKLLRLGSLRSPHVNFVNLEGTMMWECNRFRAKRYAFVMAPEVLLSFARAGFNMFSLANNHADDCVEPRPETAYRDVANFFRQVAPKTVWHGTAAEPEELWRQIPILVVRGVRIGFVAIKAWENDPASTVGNLTNRHQIFQALQSAKVDLRVLSLHGGEERSNAPTGLMMDIAREFVGSYSGDIVFGHHTHTIQGFEVLKKNDGRIGAIFYSLGNFLHDGLSSRGEGMMAQVKATRKGLMPGAIRVFPLNSENALPGPASSHDLKFAHGAWHRSMEAIASRPLPLGSGLRRLPLRLQSVLAPAPGYKVKLEGFTSPQSHPVAKSTR